MGWASWLPEIRGLFLINALAMSAWVLLRATLSLPAGSLNMSALLLLLIRVRTLSRYNLGARFEDGRVVMSGMAVKHVVVTGKKCDDFILLAIEALFRNFAIKALFRNLP